MRSFLVARSPSHSHSFAVQRHLILESKTQSQDKWLIITATNDVSLRLYCLSKLHSNKSNHPQLRASSNQFTIHGSFEMLRFSVGGASLFDWFATFLGMRSLSSWKLGRCQALVSRSRESCVNPTKLDSTKQWCFWSRHSQIYYVISNRCLSLEQCVVLNGWDAPN